MAFTGWAQDVDFSSQDHGAVTLDQAENLIRTFDWPSRAATFEELLRSNKDACPAGIGIVGEKSLFHLYAPDASSFELRVELPSTGKFLGLIPKPGKSHTIPIKALDEGIALLRLFFTDQPELRARLEQRGA